MRPFKDIGVEVAGMVATIEMRRPPHNYFDIALIREIAGALQALDEDPAVRAVVLAAQGKAFCAGAKLGGGGDVVDVLQDKAARGQAGTLYAEAVRTFRTNKADRRGHSRCGGGRRPGAGAGAGPARHVP